MFFQLFATHRHLKCHIMGEICTKVAINSIKDLAEFKKSGLNMAWRLCRVCGEDVHTMEAAKYALRQNRLDFLKWILSHFLRVGRQRFRDLATVLVTEFQELIYMKHRLEECFGSKEKSEWKVSFNLVYLKHQKYGLGAEISWLKLLYIKLICRLILQNKNKIKMSTLKNTYCILTISLIKSS